MEEPQPLRASVILAARNCVEPLRRTLNALESSPSRPSLEITVVDNASSDGSGQMDSEFPDVSVLRLPKNFGRTRAINIALRGAKAEYVVLLPPRFELSPDAIERMITVLEATPDAAAVSPAGFKLCEAVDAHDLFRRWKAGELPESWSVPVLLRRSFLTGMRNLDQRFGDFGADLDLCAQIRGAGKRAYTADDVIAVPLACPPAESSPAEDADVLNGIASYAGKYEGFAAGLRVRAGAAAHVLGKLLMFSRPGYNFARLTAILSGQKVDGDQPGAEQ